MLLEGYLRVRIRTPFHLPTTRSARRISNTFAGHFEEVVHLLRGARPSRLWRLCGKEGFRCEFVTASRISLMPASGLERFGLARFEGGKRFLPDASFGCAGRQRRRGDQAREDEAQEQDYFFSRTHSGLKVTESRGERRESVRVFLGGFSS